MTGFDEQVDEQQTTEPPAPEPGPKRAQPLENRLRLVAAVTGGLVVAGLFVLGFFYAKYARLIDRRLAVGAFANTVNVYGAPRTVAVGDSLTAADVVARLRRSGYSEARGNPVGWYRVRAGAVEIFPGRASFSGGGSGVLEFSGGKVARVVSLEDNTERNSYPLEPAFITNISEHREKRQLVRFAEIPPSLVHAVISAEDKHFFRHSGFDIFRIAKAAYVDIRDGRKEQGASTLSMQLARGLWLEPDKRWRRKIEELLITMHLERRLSKQQIFEYYANEVYLGRNGSFSVNGFGEGAHDYFGKDISQLSNDEAALLAGLVQRPSYYNPYRYPERARERRNVVLSLMRENGYLSDAEYGAARQAPVRVIQPQAQSQEDQYFVDLMNSELQNRLEDREEKVRSVYTTLDPDLQAAAEEAVRTGMKEVDQRLRKRKGGAHPPPGEPQAALVALDPRTGEIRALVGGRDYRASQLNHALSMRQPGSVFKPFVYAAALDTALEGAQKIFTPSSLIDDEPTVFTFGRTLYQPKNFERDFMGPVTLRTALAHSLNVAAVSLAQQVGYEKVVALARRAGFNDNVEPTPSVALGSYEATPLEVAGAYSTFANQGVRVEPRAIALVRARNGAVLYRGRPETSKVLDPRVNFLMVSMMQEVLRSGTGAGVWSRGFNQPAAGKTGTSRDGWFAGFTSNLLCVVWVGFDDNRDLNLEGARSALPIWAEFMKRAGRLRDYRDAKSFAAPKGIVEERICPESGELAGAWCPETRSEFFIAGTEPAVECELHSLYPVRMNNPVDLMASPDDDGRP